MKITNRVANLLVVLFIALMILLVSLNVGADEKSVYDDKNHHYDELVKGDKGDSGRDGINGSNGINGRDAPTISNNLNYSRSIAVAASLGQIPALSHVGSHNHSGIGMGVANYDNQNALSIGLLHQENNRSYKATLGISGSERIVGAGGSWAF